MHGVPNAKQAEPIMHDPSNAYLGDRGVLRVGGEEARAFLDRILTADIDRVSPTQATLAALLSPQGKILFAFLVAQAPEADGGAFYLDVARGLAPDLLRRLTLYRLRAKVEITDLSDELGIGASWGDASPPDDEALVFADPRLPALGWRMIAPRAALADLPDADAYHARRIGLGVPEGGKDYAFGDAFPHEALLDQLGGADFRKGCYIGQEVVSRMEHRGTARTRIVPVVFDEGVVPVDGIVAHAGERIIGRVGSCANGRGLAMLRLDRVADAMAAGVPLVAGGLVFHVEIAPWARFALPAAGEAQGA